MANGLLRLSVLSLALSVMSAVCQPNDLGRGVGPLTPCSDDDDCDTSVGESCNADKGFCGVCTDDDDCTAGNANFCSPDPIPGKCVECAEDDHCREGFCFHKRPRHGIQARPFTCIEFLADGDRCDRDEQCGPAGTCMEKACVIEET